MQVNGYGSEVDSKANHVGVNIDDMNSSVNEPAAYIKECTEAQKEEFSMEESDAVQTWIDYGGEEKIVDVTIAPRLLPKNCCTFLCVMISICFSTNVTFELYLLFSINIAYIFSVSINI